MTFQDFIHFVKGILCHTDSSFYFFITFAVRGNQTSQIDETIYLFNLNVVEKDVADRDHMRLGNYHTLGLFWLMDNPMAILSAASLSRSACNLSWVDPVNAASSAYRILFMFCPPMLMPGKCSIFRKIISSYKFQKSGDMTQPCLTPLLISTKCLLHY